MPRLLVIAVACALALSATATAAGADSHLVTVKGQSEPAYDGVVEESFRVETPHGSIYGDVVRPVVPDGVKVPVILTYSPYNVIGSPSPLAGSTATDAVADYFVPRGYARAVFDVVGTRESGGCYDYGGIRERETGAAVVDFLGSREWSNGKVGMIGGSYDGTTQWAAAIEQPEHLAAIVPQVAIDRWYDYAYAQGVRYFLNSENATDEGFDTPLAFDFGFGALPPTDVTDPAFATILEERITPCDRLLHTEHAYETDPVYDAFWDERDYRRHADRIEAAVLVEGGWLDHNVKHWGSTRMFEALPPHLPKHLVMGQWAHASSQHEDAQDLRHAWFDHFLLGLDTGVQRLPDADSQANDGTRRQSATWPPPSTRPVSWQLGVEDAAALVLQDSDAPAWTDSQPGLTEEQALAGGCGDACLTFFSEPVSARIRIAGSPVLEMTATTDATSTHVTPVLVDQAEDGTIQIVTRGFLNARNRSGLDRSEPLTPDAAWMASVELWDVDWVVEPGHRLGIIVMSTNVAWALSDYESSGATTTLDLDETQLVLPVVQATAKVGPPSPDPSRPAAAPDEALSSPKPSTAAAPGGTSAPLPTTGGSFSLIALGALGAGGVVARGRHRQR